MNRKILQNLSLAAISFEVVTLCSDTTPLPLLLPLLERSLVPPEFIKLVKHHLRLSVDSLHGVKTVTPTLKLYLERGRSRKGPNPTNKG